nr:tetratricopeptide repeat protein [Candidatus Delongbacteria bacterium]
MRLWWIAGWLAVGLWPGWLWSQTATPDSLRRVIERTLPENQAGLWRQLAELYINFSLPDALQSAEKALELSLRYPDRHDRIKALILVGDTYNTMGYYHRSIQYLEEALSLSSDGGDEGLRTRALFTLGDSYFGRNEFSRALDYYLQAERQALALKDSFEISNALYFVGRVHQVQGNREAALDFFRRSLAIDRERGDDSEIGSSLNSVGSIYSEMNRLDSAALYFQSAIDHYRRAGEEFYCGILLGNLGDVYQKMGDWEKAADYYHQSIRQAEKSGNKDDLASGYLDLAWLYYRTHQWDQVLPSARLSYRHFKDIHSLAGIRDVSNLMYQFHESCGRYDSSLWYCKQFHRMVDSLERKEEEQKFRELEIEYQIDKKESEIVLLKQEKRIQSMLNIGLIGSSILFLVIVVILLNRYQIKKEANRRLDELARTDPLTGLLNRRAILDVLQQEISRSCRIRKPFAVIMADIDDFKLFNDEFGHDCGDSILQSLSGLMQQTLR